MLVATMAGSLSVETAVGSTGIGGVASIFSGGSTTVAVEGSAVVKSPLGFILIGVTAPGGYVQPAPFTGTIQATSSKTIVDGAPVVREGDESVVNVPLVQVPSGSPTTATMIVKVSDAGQSTTRAK